MVGEGNREPEISLPVQRIQQNCLSTLREIVRNTTRATTFLRFLIVRAREMTLPRNAIISTVSVPTEKRTSVIKPKAVPRINCVSHVTNVPRVTAAVIKYEICLNLLSNT